jgi:hypothetical protein
MTTMSATYLYRLGDGNEGNFPRHTDPDAQTLTDVLDAEALADYLGTLNP